MPAQYLSTSRLSNVIHLIGLGQQTGILRVVRGHGATREMGQIQFVDGQPTAALLGQLTGSAALNVLNNWGESYYTFEEAVIGDDGSLEPQRTDALGPMYGAWPSGDSGWSNRSPGTQPPPGNMTGIPSSASWPSYGSGPSPIYSPRPPVQPSMPYNGQGVTGQLPGGAASHPGMTPSQPSAPYPAAPATTVGPQTPPPRRISRVDLSDPLPLDRRERMVLLLIDGRRSIADLVRLTRRSEDEVRAVLGNLKMLGLIE